MILSFYLSINFLFLFYGRSWYGNWSMIKSGDWTLNARAGDRPTADSEVRGNNQGSSGSFCNRLRPRYYSEGFKKRWDTPEKRLPEPRTPYNCGIILNYELPFVHLLRHKKSHHAPRRSGLPFRGGAPPRSTPYAPERLGTWQRWRGIRLSFFTVAKGSLGPFLPCKAKVRVKNFCVVHYDQ